jgi:hypothetical protein
VTWHLLGDGQRSAQQELDLRVNAAQFVGGPFGQGVADSRIQPQQDAPALAHIVSSRCLRPGP